MTRALLITFLLLTSFISYSQQQYVVSTFAGRDNFFQDGERNLARFQNPTSACIDASGNMYVSDKFNNLIRKITPDGVVSTFAGSIGGGSTNGTGTTALFNQPNGITVAASGNLYVTDTENNRIRKITPTGVVTTFAGSGNATYLDGVGTSASFNKPTGIVVDPLENVYVSDGGNNRIRKITSSGIVTTIAGSGVAAFANGTGTNASFNAPYGIALDNAGNIYVADQFNNRIRKISTAGDVTTIAGSGNGGSANGIGIAASFYLPSGVAIDALGNVIVADEANCRIRKIATSGMVTTIAGSNFTGDANGTITNATFYHPCGLVIDNTGNIYAVDKYNNRIRKITVSGVVSTFAGCSNYADGTGSDAVFDNPYGISFDIAGNLFIADCFNERIRKITATGIVTTVAGSGDDAFANGTGIGASFKDPRAIVLDATGNAFLADGAGNRIRKISPTGVVTTHAGSGIGDGLSGCAYSDGTGASASLCLPTGAAIDASGNVYIADNGNNRIRKITPLGVVTTFAGSGNAGNTDGIGTSASFNQPYGLAVDASGNVFVADAGNNKIRKITTTGVVTTVAGSGSRGYSNGIGTTASFSVPMNIALDASGNVYVADTYNNLIRKITPSGVVTTIAGTGISGFGDGIGTLSSFRNPIGIAVDTFGNVYVADSQNSRIRKIKPCTITRSSISRTICRGSSYIFGTRSLTTSGIYTNTITNAAGCDSVITLNLTFILPTRTATSRSICRGSSYFFGGRVITTSGNYNDTLSNRFGCDSIIVLTLTVNQSISSSISRSICTGSSYFFGGIARTTSGAYTNTITNTTGCDSVITLNLTVNPVTTSNISRSICAGSSFLFGGIARTTAGTYTNTILNSAGCDSIITLTLAVNTALTSNISKSICTGSSYFFGGRIRTTSGSYYDTLANRFGCDSIIVLSLSVSQSITSSISRSICSGSSYLFGGIARTTAGTYTNTITNTTGCDSVITLTLSINSPTSSIITSSLCQGKRLYFGSQILTSAGIYTNTLPNAAGCDSTITLNLAMNPVSASASSATICAGKLFTFGGVNLDATGIYVDTMKNKYGCDSVVSLDLRINPIPTAPTITQKQDTLFATTNGGHYQWYKGDTLLDGDTLSYFKTNYIAGYYKVIANKNSCNSPFSSIIKVSNTKLIGSLTIYPNPATSHFTIKVTSPTTVQVLNIIGQVVITQNVSGTTDVNTSTLPSGTYVVLAEGFDATRLVVTK